LIPKVDIHTRKPHTGKMLSRKVEPILAGGYSAKLRTAVQGIWKDDRGQEIVEAAVVLPLLIALLLAIIWFGRAFNIYETITRAAREGARLAVAPTCSSCAPPACSWKSSGGQSTNFPCADPVIYEAVKSSLSASSINAASVKKYTPPVTFCTALPPTAPAAGCVVVNNIQVCRGVQLGNAASNPQECGTLVSLAYPFEFSFPIAKLPAVTIHAAVQMREEY
jgi:hypothetical protein